MSPFHPEGEKARWEYAYEVLMKAEEDSPVSYEVLAQAMSLDPSVTSTRTKVQMAVHRATRELEQQARRTVEAVRGVGYKVVKPEGHLDLAKLHHKKAGRSLVRGRAKVDSVDLNRIGDPETRKAIEMMALAFGQQLEFNRRTEKRLRKQDYAIEMLKAESQQNHRETVSEVEELRARQEQTDVLLSEIASKLGVLPLPEDSSH